MDLRSDSQGFIIGERRLRELRDGINRTQADMQAIIAALQAQSTQNEANLATTLAQLAASTAALAEFTANNRNRRRATRDVTNRVGRPPNRPRPPSISDQFRQRYENANPPAANPPDSGGNGGAGRNDGRTEQSRLNRMGEAIGNAVGQQLDVNAEGVDPLVDSVRELNQIVSPARRAFTLMGRGALWLFKRNRKPEISDEQDDANDQSNRNDLTRNKLLQKLIDAVRAARSGGGGLLGGLLGRGRGMFGLLGKLGKGVLKRIPLLGALIGGGVLASKWDGLDKEGKYGGVGGVAGGGIGAVIGGTLGSIVPVLGTAIGAAVGGVVGTWLGEKAGKKLSEWTDYLKDEDIGGRIGNAWQIFTNGISTWFRQRFTATTDAIKTGFDSVVAAFLVVPNFIQNTFDEIAARFGNKNAQARIDARARQEEAKKQPPMVFRNSEPQIEPSEPEQQGFLSKLKDNVMGLLGNKEAQARVAARNAGQVTIGGVLGDAGNALMTKPGGSSMQGFKGGNIAGLNEQETLAFANRVMSRENKSGRLNTVNRFGYTGKYQFGASALAETGFIDKAKLAKMGKGVKNGSDAKAHKAFLADKSNWIKGDWETYKSSAEMQDESFRKLTESNIKQGASIHRGDKSKMLGFAMAAHLKGAGNAKKWYTKGIDSKDGNGTRISDYAKFGEATLAGLPTATQPTMAAANVKPLPIASTNKPTVQAPFAMPTSMPTKSPFSLKIPPTPAESRQVSSNDKAQINVSAPQVNIGQNVGDRTIAHIVTGGFGMNGMDV